MRRLLLTLALLLGAGAAQADNGLFYVGAGVVRDKLERCGRHQLRSRRTSWKVLAGFRPISLFAVEADYIDLGSQTSNVLDINTHLQYKAFGAYAVGFAPIPVPYLDVFGKLGLAALELERQQHLPVQRFVLALRQRHPVRLGRRRAAACRQHRRPARVRGFNIRNTYGANVVSLSVFLNLL